MRVNAAWYDQFALGVNNFSPIWNYQVFTNVSLEKLNKITYHMIFAYEKESSYLLYFAIFYKNVGQKWLIMIDDTPSFYNYTILSCLSK